MFDPDHYEEELGVDRKRTITQVVLLALSGILSAAVLYWVATLGGCNAG